MTTIEMKRAELASILANIAEKQAEIDGFEYESTDSEYDAYLDEVYGEVEIGGYTYSTSNAIKNVDPTAYRCGKADHDSAKDLDNVPEYATLLEELEELENQRDNLEEEIEEEENEE